MIRTKKPVGRLKIGNYIVLTDEQYVKLLEVLNQGTFHTSGNPINGWKIKIIDKQIKLGLKQIL